MSVEAIEKFEMISALGAMVIVLIFYVGLAVVCLVLSSKKKKTDPKDAKNWKNLGIILLSVGGVAVLGSVAAFVVPMILYEASVGAVFVM